MKLELDDLDDAVLLDVLNDVSPCVVERTGESREVLGILSLVDGVITFYTGGDPFSVHRSDILTVRPIT